MAKSVVVGIVAGRPSILLLFTLMITAIRSSQAFDLLSRSTGTCPSSYQQCSSARLPDNFCCPSSATCISLDNATSAICCPAGRSCDYISPIVCDIQQQNPALNPKNSIKTTRLNDSLPKCGDSCCPFGYTCQYNSTCELDQNTTTTATAALPETSTSTSSSTPATTDTAVSKTTNPTTGDPRTTETSTLGAKFTPVPSPSSKFINVGSTSAANPQQTCPITSQCPSFPSRAVVAGFFPGAVFGGILAALISMCLRRRTRRNEVEIQDAKPWPHWSERTSTGALMGISNPIPSDDVAYRTDFLLRPAQGKRASVSARSTRTMLHRTGSRVRNLFSGAGPLKPDHDAPPVPGPVTPPRQRQPSTESIKIYSPPGAFAQSNKFLGPEPYPSAIARPDTTFTDLMQVAGFNDAKGEPCYRVRTPVPRMKRSVSRK